MSFSDEVKKIKSTALSPKIQDEILQRKYDKISDQYVEQIQQSFLSLIRANTIIGKCFETEIAFRLLHWGDNKPLSLDGCQSNEKDNPWNLKNDTETDWSKVSDSFVFKYGINDFLVVFDYKDLHRGTLKTEYIYSTNKYGRYFFESLKRKLEKDKIHVSNIAVNSKVYSYDVLCGNDEISMDLNYSPITLRIYCQFTL